MWNPIPQVTDYHNYTDKVTHQILALTLHHFDHHSPATYSLIFKLFFVDLLYYSNNEPELFQHIYNPT